ncbi:MAG: 5'-nucleotidase C-terminal domain-containing protein [Breznakibacter sp.]
MVSHVFKLGLLWLGFIGAPLYAQVIDTGKPAYIKVADERPVPELEAFIRPYRDSIESQMNRVIGKAGQLMVAKKPESPLSNLVADVLLWAVNEKPRTSSGLPRVDLAITNIKGIRSAINAGDIALRNIFEILPFENTVVVLGLTGEQVLKLFDFIASQNGDGISGASFTMVNGKAVNGTIGGKKVKAKKIYYIAVPDYVANGGDSYTILTQYRSRIDTELKMRDVMVEYIEGQTREGKEIVPNVNRRIINANE